MVAPNGPRSFWFNLNLVLMEIGRWPIATTIVLTMLTVGMVLQPPDPQLQFSPIENTLMLAGSLVGILGMKGWWLLLAHPKLRKAPFPGSPLRATAIAFVPIFTFFATFLYIVPAKVGDDFPLLGRISFLLFAYLLFVTFCTGFMHALHAMWAYQGSLSNLLRKN
jgi:hypothetical protein